MSEIEVVQGPLEIVPQLMVAAIRFKEDNSARTAQSNAGLIGASDLGFCRRKAYYMAKGVPQSDATGTMAKAMGTAWHDYSGDAYKTMFPDWIVNAVRVVAKYPSGWEVGGTPDIIIPEYNMIVDDKTKDGYAQEELHGPSKSNLFQRHNYALGAIREGILDDSKPVLVANMYWDRSAGEEEPLFIGGEMDPTLTLQIDEWINDVAYAIEHGIDHAEQDVAAPICETICPFFTVCRGQLPVGQGMELIEDEQRLQALDDYITYREVEKNAKKFKENGRDILANTNGIGVIDGVRWQVRNTYYPPTDSKAGSTRIDVRKVSNRKGKSKSTDSPATAG